MEKITGRNDDMIILRGVNLFPTQIEEIVLGLEELTPHFILELTRTGTMDDLTVRIERHPDLSVEVCQGSAAVLAARIKEFIGSSVRVQLEEPGTLPRSEGKYQRVYDLRNQ
jgi:phenylacetate-CoA ligase